MAPTWAGPGLLNFLDIRCKMGYFHFCPIHFQQSLVQFLIYTAVVLIDVNINPTSTNLLLTHCLQSTKKINDYPCYQKFGKEL